MRLPVPFRRRPVLWLLLPALPLLLVVANESQTSQPLEGYWTSTVAHSVLLIIVPAAVSATGAALEAARLRTRREENAIINRRAIAVILDALWPSYLFGLMLQVVAIGIASASAWGGDSDIPWSLLLTIAAIILFHTAVGFFLGSLLRPAIGVPVALAFSYSWLGFTGTIGWFAPRHLAGLVLETCCFYDQQPSAGSMAAATVFSVVAAAGLLVAASATLRLTALPRAVAISTALVLVGSGTGGGLLLAAELPSMAAVPRGTEALHCSDGSVVVCLYPEQTVDTDPTENVERMLERLADAGVDVPRRVVASDGNDDDGDGIAFRYLPGMTDEQIAASLASSFNGDMTLECDGEATERTIARQDVGDVARAWLTIRLLGSPHPEPDNFAAPILESSPSVEDLLSAPEADQARWIARALLAMSDCDAHPPRDLL